MVTVAQYPLKRLKRLREFELQESAAALRKIAEEVSQLQSRIFVCDERITQISMGLANSELESGRIIPELRSNVALCIKVQEAERREHEQSLSRAVRLWEKAYARVLESKQASKMIDRHEERYRSAACTERIRQMGNEADDLYLARVGGG